MRGRCGPHRRRRRRSVGLLLAVLACAGGLFVGAPRAFAAGAVAVTPSTGLVDGQVVSISGSGWNSGALIGYCEAVPLEPISESDCATAIPDVTTADVNGNFSVSLTVQRLITVGNQLIDCAAPSAPCVLAAADANDIPGTAVWQTLHFASAPPLIIPGSVTQPEGDAGTSTLSVPVTLSYASTQPVSIDWMTDPSATCPGTPAEATPGTDYTAAAGTLTFAPGDTSTTIPISVFGDTTIEPDECVAVSFTNPVNAEIGPNRFGSAVAFGVIKNDDTLIPDMGIRRRSDGALLFGGSDFHMHAIAPSGTWTFAVLVRNDGNRTGDLKVQALTTVGSPFLVQYFYGYFDLTSTVEGGGLLFPAVAPGDSRLFAVRFSADSTTPTNASAQVTLQATTVPPPGVSRLGYELRLQVDAST
jgi:hypothetical protein